MSFEFVAPSPSQSAGHRHESATPSPLTSTISRGTILNTSPRRSQMYTSPDPSRPNDEIARIDRSPGGVNSTVRSVKSVSIRSLRRWGGTPSQQSRVVSDGHEPVDRQERRRQYRVGCQVHQPYRCRPRLRSASLEDEQPPRVPPRRSHPYRPPPTPTPPALSSTPPSPAPPPHRMSRVLHRPRRPPEQATCGRTPTNGSSQTTSRVPLHAGAAVARRGRDDPSVAGWAKISRPRPLCQRTTKMWTIPKDVDDPAVRP